MCMKTVKKQILPHKQLEFVFLTVLTTEQEEYAVFATTEFSADFKERFAKTHRSITDVS